MCNLYRLTSSIEAIRAFTGALSGAGSGSAALLADARFYPGRPAPVAVEGAGGRRLESMIWGVPGPRAAGGRPVTNVRNLESPFWRPLLGAAERVLVPASAFCEWSADPDPATGRKQQHWFALRDEGLFAFAGLFRADEAGGPARFAFLTGPPNALVGAVHPKAMPVILDRALAEAWLGGADARAFQQPMAAERMVELRER